jgi:NADP-dependent 3-hydroxy acid dehydrogenase YdfG
VHHRGFGAAIAQRLANEGASLALAARDVTALDKVADEIRRQGGTAFVIPADITDDKQIRAAVDKARLKMGRLDILANSAGVMLLGPIVDGNPEEWRQMIEINMLGLMYAVHAALPAMLAQVTGHIVNISSVAGRVVWSAGAGGHMASKFAVNAFSESRRQEVAEKEIRVTVMEPGIVATPLTENRPRLWRGPTFRDEHDEKYSPIGSRKL